MDEILKIPTPPVHSYQLIAVAGQKLQHPVSDYQFLQDENGQKYKIITQYTYAKDQHFPKGLMMLATGKNVHPDQVWNGYKRSKRIVFFIVEKI